MTLRQAQGERVGVLGAGAWGTALAQMLASDGRDVLIWARESELVAEINSAHTNSVFLPSVTLAKTIRATGDLAEMAALDTLLVVTPCLLYTSPSPRDRSLSRMPSSA